MGPRNFETEKSLRTSNKETLRQGRGSGNSLVLKCNYLLLFHMQCICHMGIWYTHYISSLVLLI